MNDTIEPSKTKPCAKCGGTMEFYEGRDDPGGWYEDHYRCTEYLRTKSECDHSENLEGEPVQGTSYL